VATTGTIPAAWPKKTLERGDDRSWTEFFEKNTGTEDAPVWVPKDDLADYDFLCQIRALPDSTVVMATVTVELTTDGTDGYLTLTIPHGEAENLVPGTVYIDLELTRTADGWRQTYLSGKWKVEPDTSRAV
jgi:hypothetical protein